jgi:hypothetical protein
MGFHSDRWSPPQVRASTSVRLMTLFASIVFSMVVPNPAAAATHVVIGEVATRDPSQPIYQISLPELGGREAPAGRPLGEVVRMVTARGQVLLCGVPTPEPELDSDVMDVPSTGDTDDSEGVEFPDDFASFELADQLLSEYNGKCFRRSEGWWSYVFCYGVSIEQKHVAVSKDEQEMTFILGMLDAAFDAGRRLRPKDVSTIDAPYTQLYGNGTRCDVSGKPRQILVKYKCNQEALQLGSAAFGADLNVISAVREVETCVYEIDFVNSAICAHPAYKNKLEKNVLPINCVMEEESDVFLGLSSLNYKKAALNL